jgi:hypothetical protein
MGRTKKSDDIYWDMIVQEWPRIIAEYQEHEEKKPILEYSFPDRLIYAYPANEYIDSLSLSTREDTRKEYQQACLSLK